MSSANRLSSHSRIGPRFLQRSRYRAGQFWRGLNARVSAQERMLAAQILPPDALALFDRMPADAQRHSFNVLHTVRKLGIHNADLDAAALLHDVGKLAAEDGGVPLSLWLRSPLVLMEAWSPRTLRRLAGSDPAQGWRLTAYVHLEHPRIGAEWAADTGCSELTCWLIRHHQEDLAVAGGSAHRLRLLNALQLADNSA